MTSYRISRLAEVSGVPATTLRFYEDAGLLSADRTPSGYRVYGDDAVERLAFISSAKLLGLALEEIRELLEVREEGVCASVRARMLPLVAARIAETDARIAELRAFSSRLAGVHGGLAGPAPAGACGPDCGCTTTAAPGPVPVRLSRAHPVPDPDPESWRQAPVACTLGGTELGERTEQWRALIGRAERRETIPDGLRLVFPSGAGLAAEVAALAAAEQSCCTFFDFTLRLAPGALQLDVRAPEHAAGMLAVRVSQQGPQGLVERIEHHQVAIYLAATAAGALLGWTAPAAGPGLEHAISPVLGALLFVTFLQVPVAELVHSLRDGRFLSAALVVNFVLVPPVVAAMFVFLPADQGVRLGVLLVLLCPCVDYVIVFSGLAGGSSRRLLAATPLLLVAQMALPPVFLYLFMGSGLADIVEVGPFLDAFLFLIVIPLALAWCLQAWAARRLAGQKVSDAVTITMVPLMVATLLVVVASQIPKLDERLGDVAAVVPFYVVFLAAMALAGKAVARLFRLDAPASRAIVFTGATRNSLVVLPLALALPDDLAVAAVVVVTQTLVEVIGMVAYVRLVPRLVPEKRPAAVR